MVCVFCICKHLNLILIKEYLHLLNEFLIILFIYYYYFHACTQEGLEPLSRALRHLRTNDYANVTPLPPTPIGKVPFCVHSHRAHLIYPYLRTKVLK